jgi:hypothetical protein
MHAAEPHLLERSVARDFRIGEIVIAIPVQARLEGLARLVQRQRVADVVDTLGERVAVGRDNRNIRSSSR